MENDKKNVFIHPSAIIYPNVILDDDVYVGPNCIIGEPTSSYYKSENKSEYEFMKTEIGEGSILRAGTIIYEGTKIGKNFQTGHNVTIREKTIIGDNCSVGTLGDVQKECNLGDFVRLHSNVFLGEYTKINNYVWLFPHVVVTNDKYPPMDNLTPCVIDEYAIVAAGAILLPGVKIGKNSLVAAGSIVSKDVEDYHFVKGTPSKDCGRVENIKDNGKDVYPWKDHLNEYRGYPWQVKIEKE